MKRYKIKIDGKPFDVEIDGIGADGVASVTVNGKARRVEVDPCPDASSAAPKVQFPAAAGSTSGVSISDSSTSGSSTAGGSIPGGGAVVTSPLPGVILSVKVNAGDKVSAGDCVAVVEAMKMENEIQAETGGTVGTVFVCKGDSVLEGAKILTIL